VQDLTLSASANRWRQAVSELRAELERRTTPLELFFDAAAAATVASQDPTPAIPRTFIVVRR